MKTRFSRLFILFIAWLGCVGSSTSAATLQDFGYENMTVNGTVASGNRKLLVVLASYTDAAAFATNSAHYDDFFFNFFAQPGVNNYYLEVSDGRFFWARGGTISISLPFSQMFTNFNTGVTDVWLRDQLYASNIIHQAMLSGQFNFAAYDDNANGTVAQEELQIVIVTNDGDNNGANRLAGCIRPPGFAYTVCAGSVALLNHRTDFATVCHELAHSLGPIDIYGPPPCRCLSIDLSLMGGTGASPGNPRIFHLDPWHKMQLGWNEPRIRSLRSGGIDIIPAAQVSNPSAPLLLYDPAVGSGEFFLVEYRAPRRAAGRANDAQARDDGMVIWHVQHGANKKPLLVENGAIWTMWPEGAPGLLRSQFPVWDAANASRSTTPYLRWNNGTSTRTRLHVRPFTVGDENIVVEWWAEEEVWVDFNYISTIFSPESGTFSEPFNTLAEGVNVVPYGGTIKFKTGSSAETALISKRMTLEAYNGPVLIGR